MKTRPLILFIFLSATMTAGVGLRALSQEQWEEEGGEIESVEIEIVKEREISLPRANRNFEKIPPRPVEPIAPEMRYDFKGLRFSSPDFNPSIRPLRLKQEELSRIYGNYLSAGFGTYNSPFLQGSINSKRNAEKFYGLDLYHHSFGKGPVDERNSGSGNTRINFFAAGFGPKISAQADLNFETLSTHFYGYRRPPGAEIRRDTIFQSYNIFGLSGGIKNTKPSDFNFQAKGSFSYLTDHYLASESELGLDFNSYYNFDDEKSLIFRANYFLIARKDSLVEPKPRHLLSVAPAFRFMAGGQVKFSVGTNLVLENDRDQDQSFHVYPDLQVSYPLSKFIESYATLTGGMDKVSLHSLSRENPWLKSNLDIYHSNRALEFEAGMKGTVARRLSFDGGLSLIRWKHLYFYKNDPGNRAKFTTAYDDALRLNFFAETGIAETDKLMISLRGDYFSYATDTLDHPWHRPLYRVSFNGTYRLAGKVLLTLNFISQGGMKAYDNELSREVELKPALDMNAKVRYFLSKQISFYVEGDNILNKDYLLYLNYPVRGAQVSGGASWSF